MGLVKALVGGLILGGLSGCVLSGPTPPETIAENTIPSPREILDSVGNKPDAPSAGTDGDP